MNPSRGVPLNKRASWPLRFAMAVIAILASPSPYATENKAQAPGEDLAIWPVRGSVYMISGPAGNATVQVGKDGILLVDTLTAEVSAHLLAAIRKISDGPIRFIVNTHAHPDHVGGNAVIAAAGDSVAGGNVEKVIANPQQGAAVIAHENVLTRMTLAELPFEALPTMTYIAERKVLFLNGEGIQIDHQPSAHTDGDSIVFFRRSDVISAGGVFTPGRYPFVDVKNGGTIQGTIDALNHIIDLAISEDKEEGGTMIIPGHGRLCDEFDVVEYRDMLTIVQDFVRELIKEGRSLEQIQQAKPTMGYDAIYASDVGPWTTRQFVEAVYRELTRKGR